MHILLYSMYTKDNTHSSGPNFPSTCTHILLAWVGAGCEIIISVGNAMISGYTYTCTMMHVHFYLEENGIISKKLGEVTISQSSDKYKILFNVGILSFELSCHHQYLYNRQE